MTYFDKLLQEPSKKNKQIYLLGDYNIDLLKITSNSIITLMNVIASHGFYVGINLSTRVTNSSLSIIDNILTNDNDITPGVFYSSITDHMPIFCYKRGVYKNDSEQSYTYRKINDLTINSFFVELSNIDWGDVLRCMDADKAYTLFMNIFLKLHNKHFPLTSTKKRRKNKKPWATNKLLKFIKKKNKCVKIFCQTRRTSDERKFKQI